MYSNLIRRLLGRFDQNPEDLEKRSYNKYKIEPDIVIYGSSYLDLVHFGCRLPDFHTQNPYLHTLPIRIV